jgi:hypothetical protein
MAVTLSGFAQDTYTTSSTMATTFGSGTPGPTHTNLVMVVLFDNAPGATSSPGAGWTLLARTETLASSNLSIENYVGGTPQYIVAEMWWSTTTSSLSGTQTGKTWCCVVAEGYATAASIHEATGLPVAVAFDAGNLAPVAEVLKKRYPRAAFIIAADDDYLTEGNPGVSHAQTAALAVDGSVLAPTFATDRDGKKITDFNDLHQIEGLHVVAKQVADHLAGLGWAVSPALHGAGGARKGGGESENDPRPAAVAIMELDEIVDRFLPIDDGTGRVVFDRWTNKLVQKDQMLALLPAVVEGEAEAAEVAEDDVAQ